MLWKAFLEVFWQIHQHLAWEPLSAAERRMPLFPLDLYIWYAQVVDMSAGLSDEFNLPLLASMSDCPFAAMQAGRTINCLRNVFSLSDFACSLDWLSYVACMIIRTFKQQGTWCNCCA